MSGPKQKAGDQAGLGNLSVPSVPQMLTVAAAAHALSLSQSFVRRLIVEGRLPAARFGRALRVPAEGLAAFVACGLRAKEGGR
jgi:excisionase family DNA binding protein